MKRISSVCVVWERSQNRKLLLCDKCHWLYEHLSPPWYFRKGVRSFEISNQISVLISNHVLG